MVRKERTTVNTVLDVIYIGGAAIYAACTLLEYIQKRKEGKEEHK